MCHGVPATGPRWSSSTTSTSSASTARSSFGARGVERRAARVVPARREHDGPRAGRGQRVGDHPALVDGDRHEPQAERAREVEHAGPAGILDRDRVAGGEVRRENALDPVERAVDGADPRGGHAVGRERRDRHLRELGQHRLGAVQPLRGVDLAQSGGEVGQQRRIGAAGREVARAGRHLGDVERPTAPAAARPPAAAARARDHHASPPQVGHRGRHGGRADAERGRRAPHRGHRRARATARRRRCRPPGCPRSRWRRSPAADTVLAQSATVLQQKGLTPLKSPRTKLRRIPKRGAHDRETIDAILDEALVCHLGFVHDGRPAVIPTLHARVGDEVYPRLGGEPGAAGAGGRDRGVPDGDADRRARARPLGVPPLDQLPRRRALRHGAPADRTPRSTKRRSRRSPRSSCPAAGPTCAGRPARSSRPRPRWRCRSPRARPRSAPARRSTTTRTTRSTRGRAWCRCGPRRSRPSRTRAARGDRAAGVHRSLVS